MKKPKKKPSTMSSQQFSAALDKLGLSQRKAGPWLGLTSRTAHNYATGAREVSETVARLLRLVINVKLTADEAAKLMKQRI